MRAAADDVVLDGRIQPREIGGEAADADDQRAVFFGMFAGILQIGVIRHVELHFMAAAADKFLQQCAEMVDAVLSFEEIRRETEVDDGAILLRVVWLADGFDERGWLRYSLPCRCEPQTPLCCKPLDQFLPAWKRSSGYRSGALSVSLHPEVPPAGYIRQDTDR